MLIFPRPAADPDPDSPLDSKIAFDKFKAMAVGQKRALIVSIAHAADVGEEALDNMLQAAGVIEAEEKEGPREIDLEDVETIHDLILQLVYEGISSEKFTAIMSDLRDCADDFRRANIIDRMISFAFKESRTSMQAEAEWRKRYEAQLPPDPPDEE